MNFYPGSSDLELAEMVDRWNEYESILHESLRDFGFLEGGYSERCGRCGLSFFGAKRSILCKRCAMKQLAESIRLNDFFWNFLFTKPQLCNEPIEDLEGAIFDLNMAIGRAIGACGGNVQLLIKRLQES